MACQCAEVGLDEIFNERFAKRDAARYRKRGLPPRARLLLDLVGTFMDVRTRRSLEGGAGAGALTVELARRGAADAEAVDATPVAVTYARELAAKFDVADRARFHSGDFADPTLNLEPADLVILDRVLCCYPDWLGLLENAAKHARQVIAITYPGANRANRIWTAMLNGCQALLRRRFRLYLHSPESMLAMLRQRGFTQFVRKRYWLWEIAVVSRP